MWVHVSSVKRSNRIQGKKRNVATTFDPKRKWQYVTANMVISVPTSHGYDAMMMFVDWLTKFIKLAPCTKEITAKGCARLFFEYVFRHFWMPESIILDRNIRFVNWFWKELFYLTRIKFKYLTAHQAEINGQSEVTICTVENYLMPYVENKPLKWAK